MSSKLDELVEGYMRGIDWNLGHEPIWLSAKSLAYRHGFQNGQDDLNGQPREKADVLRRRAEMICGEGS